jgi:hypothetical protein
MDEQGLMVKFKYQKSLKLTKEERSIIKKASVESLVAVVQEIFAEINMNALYRGRRTHPILFRRTLREQCGWAKTEIDDERMFELCPLWDDEMLDPSTPVLVSDRSSGSSGTGARSWSTARWRPRNSSTSRKRASCCAHRTRRPCRRRSATWRNPSSAPKTRKNRNL